MSRVIFFVVALFAQLVLPALAFSQTLTISWEVENRFRFYRSAATFQYYASVAKTELPKGRADWILTTERELQEKYYRDDQRKQMFPGINRPDDDNDWNGWASLTREETCRDRHDYNLTEFIDCEDYVSPVSHTVLAKAQGAEPGAMCQWDISPHGAPLIGDKSIWVRRDAKTNKPLQGAPRPCDQQVRIEVPWAADKSAFVTVVVTVVSGGSPHPSGQDTILATDILVAGMGDSFAAGVGNPDKPAQMDWNTGIDYSSVWSGIAKKTIPVRLGGSDSGSVLTSKVYGAQSEWEDIRCFRSQYGPQFRAALHLAVLTEHAAVTFLDLSCNGARIIEGLLNAKAIDAGYSSRTPNPESQIGVASRMLCGDNNPTTPVSYTLSPAKTAANCRQLGEQRICEFSLDGENIYRNYQNLKIKKTSMTVCAPGGPGRFVRDIDVLMMSIGGNDIGFAPMVADVIIDDSRARTLIFERLGTLVGEIHDGQTGLARLGLLKSKYDVLDKALFSYLPLKGSRKAIFLTAYPMPLDDAGGLICGTPRQNVGTANDALDINSVFSQFSNSNGQNADGDTPLKRLKSVSETTCALNLKRFAWFDAGSAGNSIIEGLTKPGGACEGQAERTKLSPNDGANLGWQFVAEIIPKYQGHGFCAAEPDAQLGIPAFNDGNWTPAYSYFYPYHSHQRWVRTPNDAYVTTNWQTGVPELLDFANLLSAATTTAMHPTAEGYAAVGDALLARVGTYLCDERRADIGDSLLCK